MLYDITFLHVTAYEYFLAFSTVNGIETVHLSPDDQSDPNAPRKAITDAENMRNIIGLTFDFDHSRYFYSDIVKGNIQSVGFDGTNLKIIKESK